MDEVVPLQQQPDPVPLEGRFAQFPHRRGEQGPRRLVPRAPVAGTGLGRPGGRRYGISADAHPSIVGPAGTGLT
ncbi:hypothetical protein Sgou_16170 [Streptomyces gougerotii]|uniref:Uncharacterized protein n=2 Tax=Streptomyces diastaticus group TaxID=2849069 RepID=A0A8H9LIQ5_9ACTN|nr:hypothetical protein Srut_40830 [Streptomyces rutgersensis]GFH74639.1 hypothetical protein Sdia_54070 [Streptomyces diastaticus subsp. diastaticus]GFH76947.1 hypothetical protein Sgou_16170 [Streptomyces gougerotii]GGU04444.1 hypothetical protein GCM10015534_02760 [Streptomyces diastaticus subsp. diastaticus]GGU65970.1 hypothetical protein GCM10010227_19480 [Streptomyces gougerotii]